MSRRRLAIAPVGAALGAFVGGFLQAPLPAQELPRTDISWTAEHLPESMQDSRLLALPWPGRALVPGGWQTSVDAGWQSVTADLADATGPLLSAGATRAWSARFGLGGFLFFDQVKIAGGSSRELLRASFSDEIPLALPAFAEFTNPRGEVRHLGAGGYAVWQREAPGGIWRRTVLAGAYFESLDLTGYRMDYELVSGADEGMRGTLDFSARYNFVTPFVGIGWTRSLGSRWTLSPRIVAGQPLPRQGLEGAITGPGFSVHGSASGAAMGDGYLGAGLAFEHLPSGLGIDIGSSLYYAATESVTHEGLTRAYLVHLSWTH